MFALQGAAEAAVASFLKSQLLHFYAFQINIAAVHCCCVGACGGGSGKLPQVLVVDSPALHETIKPCQIYRCMHEQRLCPPVVCCAGTCGGGSGKLPQSLTVAFL